MTIHSFNGIVVPQVGLSFLYRISQMPCMDACTQV